MTVYGIQVQVVVTSVLYEDDFLSFYLCIYDHDLIKLIYFSEQDRSPREEFHSGEFVRHITKMFVFHRDKRFNSKEA